ncbi:MAG TPA: hypothetical protein VK714_00690 [Myxococcota bacterium]|nr:hypothetical protein [Myxococcota bacterium]
MAKHNQTELNWWRAWISRHPVLLGVGALAVVVSGALQLIIGFGTAISMVRSCVGHDPFQVATHSGIISVYPGKLVYTYNSLLGRTLAPVGVALDVDVRNLLDKPTKIFHYAVDADIDGKWRRLSVLPALGPRSVYWVLSDDLSNCVNLDFTTNSFDILIHDKSVASGESVRGWIFLEWPPDLRRSDKPPTIGKIRIELGDAWGLKQRTELPMIDWRNALQEEGEVGGEFHIPPGAPREDLRGLAVMPRIDLLHSSLPVPPK